MIIVQAMPANVIPPVGFTLVSLMDGLGGAVLVADRLTGSP